MSINFYSLSSIPGKILDIFFPPSCVICGSTFNIGCRDIICKACLEKKKEITSPYCKLCGSPSKENSQNRSYVCKECLNQKRNFDKARSYFLYDGVIKSAICIYKYKKNIKVGKWFAKIMEASLYQKLEGDISFDIICPVPLSNKRLKERGFNQSYILAYDISNSLNIPLISILKKKEKKTQVGLDDKSRWINIQGTFFMKQGREVFDINNKRILLIDDVLTTGATVNECAKVLKKNGATHITVLTLARA